MSDQDTNGQDTNGQDTNGQDPNDPDPNEQGTRIEAVQGDITTEVVDAIVNAANSSLRGGGGVDGAIHRAAGPRLLDECRELRHTAYPQGLPVGEAVATGAGDLPARWVIHTVGPNRHAGQTDPALLASCFEASLREAMRVGARSVAFPAVSAGVYGWDPAEVARIAVAAVRSSPHLAEIDLVRFVLFGPATYTAFDGALRERLAVDYTAGATHDPRSDNEIIGYDEQGLPE